MLRSRGHDAALSPAVLQDQHAKNGSDFTFVHVSHPEESKQRHTQKVIRHHVMARIADSRKKRPQTWTFEVRVPQIEVEEATSKGSVKLRVHQQDDLQCCKHVPRSLHPYGLFPVDTDIRARQLIQFMQIEGDYLYRPFRNEWFAMAVIDCTAFYLSLANAALFFHQITEGKGSEYSDFEESSKYLSLCLNQVTQRLGKEVDNVSEGIITTVLGFLCHDSSVGRWDRFAVHMLGLENILLLRGGFQSLKRNIVMFASWFDILGSSIFDTKPRFPLPPGSTISTVRQDVLSPSLQNLILQLRNGTRGLVQIATALESAAQLAVFVNNNTQDPMIWKDGATVAKLITPTMHLLLSLPRPAEYNATSARLKRAFALISEELQILQEQFSNLLRHAPRIDGHFPELALWAYIMVALAEHPGTRKLHINAISTMMRNMGIRTSKDAIACAKQLIWVDALMDSGVDAFNFEVDYACRSFLTI